MKRYYLLIDIGTGNSKLSIIDNFGKIVKDISFKNEYKIDENYADSVYFCPNEYMKILDSKLKNLLYDFDEKISAVSSASTRQSIILLGKDKAKIGLPNIDNRAKKYINNFEMDNIYKKTGKYFTEDFPAAKIMAYKEIYKKEFQKVFSFTSVSEWIGYEFTGVLSIEPSQATDTQLYDINDLKYSKKLAQKLGIESLTFPKIVKSGEKLGKISNNWVKKYKQLESSVFIVGGADTQVAMENYNNYRDSLLIVSGTTSPVIAYEKKIDNIVDDELWINSYLRGDGYILEMNPGITGLNYQNFKDAFMKDISYEQMEEDYSKIDEVKVISLLTSCSKPKYLPKKSGTFIIKTPVDSSADSFDYAWSILADIACSIYTKIRKLEKLKKKSYCKIIGMGNGFKSDTLCKMVASLSNKELILTKNYNNSTLFGLLRICNRYFEDDKSYIINEQKTNYKPVENGLIIDYYNKWKSNNIYVIKGVK